MKTIRTIGAVLGMAMLSSIGALAWAAGRPAAARPAPRRAQGALAAASAREFGSAGYGCEDTIAVAAGVGVDYKKVVDLSLAKDKRGMHLLFWLTSNARFDAASSQGHAAVLGEVLRKTGDGLFAGCLRSEPLGTRKAVLGGIDYDMGGGGKTARKYPQTFSLGRTAPVRAVPAATTSGSARTGSAARPARAPAAPAKAPARGRFD